MPDFFQRLSKVRHFVFDVDGVFTDSNILITEEGQLLRTMNVRDGYAIKVAQSQGFEFHIITGGSSVGVIKRLEGLGISDIHAGIKDKLTVLKAIMTEHELTSEQVLYMGDDEIDIPCLKLAGISCCPHDADISALSVAEFVARAKGGEGCVREVIKMVLESQDKWQPLV